MTKRWKTASKVDLHQSERKWTKVDARYSKRSRKTSALKPYHAAVWWERTPSIRVLHAGRRPGADEIIFDQTFKQFKRLLCCNKTENQRWLAKIILVFALEFDCFSSVVAQWKSTNEHKFGWPGKVIMQIVSLKCYLGLFCSILINSDNLVVKIFDYLSVVTCHVAISKPGKLVCWWNIAGFCYSH